MSKSRLLRWHGKLGSACAAGWCCAATTVPPQLLRSLPARQPCHAPASLGPWCAPSFPLKNPNGQSVHSVLPLSWVCMPRGHSRQDDAPAVGRYVCFCESSGQPLRCRVRRQLPPSGSGCCATANTAEERHLVPPLAARATADARGRRRQVPDASGKQQQAQGGTHGAWGAEVLRDVIQESAWAAAGGWADQASLHLDGRPGAAAARQ